MPAEDTCIGTTKWLPVMCALFLEVEEGCLISEFMTLGPFWKKMTWDNLALQPTLLQLFVVNCFECLCPPLLGGWDLHLRAYICQTTHSLWSLFLENFKDPSNSDVFSCYLRYPLANLISRAFICLSFLFPWTLATHLKSPHTSCHWEAHSQWGAPVKRGSQASYLWRRWNLVWKVLKSAIFIEQSLSTATWGWF